MVGGDAPTGQLDDQPVDGMEEGGQQAGTAVEQRRGDEEGECMIESRETSTEGNLTAYSWLPKRAMEAAMPQSGTGPFSSHTWLPDQFL